MVTNDPSRPGVSKLALAGALAVVVAVAGVAYYATTFLSGTATSASTTPASSTIGGSVAISVTPQSPLIAPGQTQNYSFIQVETQGSELSGALSIKALAPSGLTVTLANGSISLANDPQKVPFMLRADPGVSLGRHTVTLETSSAAVPSRNLTFSVQVVQVLVVIQNLAFHPRNLTVAEGTSVTWINLDSYIGCCDPGNHNVVFLTGSNAASPVLKQYDSWTYTFNTTGVMGYYCSIHPQTMIGQVRITG